MTSPTARKPGLNLARLLVAPLLAIVLFVTAVPAGAAVSTYRGKSAYSLSTHQPIGTGTGKKLH